MSVPDGQKLQKMNKKIKMNMNMNIVMESDMDANTDMNSDVVIDMDMDADTKHKHGFWNTRKCVSIRTYLRNILNIISSNISKEK